MNLSSFFNPPGNQHIVDLHGLPADGGRVAAWLGMPDVIAGGTMSLVAGFAAAAAYGPLVGGAAFLNTAASAAMGTFMAWHFTNRAIQQAERTGSPRISSLHINTGRRGGGIRANASVMAQTIRLHRYSFYMMAGSSALAILISHRSLLSVTQSLLNMSMPDPAALGLAAIPVALVTRFTAGWVRTGRLLAGRYRYCAPS